MGPAYIPAALQQPLCPFLSCGKQKLKYNNYISFGKKSLGLASAYRKLEAEVQNSYRKVVQFEHVYTLPYGDM